MKMKLSKLHIILLLWLSVVCFGACHKTPTRMETILCKENNLWYVYSLDTARNVFYPLWNCYTFHKENKYEDRWSTFHCYETSDGRIHTTYGNDLGKWHYYPFLNVLQLNTHNIMRLLKIENDTIVFKSSFFSHNDNNDEIFLLINLGEEYANKERPEFPANQP